LKLSIRKLRAQPKDALMIFAEQFFSAVLRRFFIFDYFKFTRYESPL